MTKANLVTWVFRLTAAIILLQTLYFKFGGADESVYIFSRLGAEPYGRIGSGILELIVAILILIPKTTWIGAIGGIVVMLGAISAHLFVLGVEIVDDGGFLFILALIILASCLILLFMNKEKITNILKKN